MNEMIEKMITRHAIRRFQDRQLEEEILEQILLAGLYAPSAGNNQRSRIKSARIGRSTNAWAI
jgi:nitroreductase